MICRTPAVPVLEGNVSEVWAAFIMDGVNIQSNYTKLTMIPNPHFKNFDGVHLLKGRQPYPGGKRDFVVI